jgi:MFS family permease
MTDTTAVRPSAEPGIGGRATSAATAAAAALARYPGRWLVFAAVLMADVMDLVDSTVTNVGGPAIRDDLGGGEALLQWLGAAYTLSFAVFLVTGARLGDLYGRRRLFLIGAAGFTAASVACALAWSPESLVATRALQGAFGALMIPQGFGMLTEVLDAREMPKAFALFGPIMGIAAVLGPIVGALLIEGDLLGTGWRMIFLVNVPLGLACLAVGARWMPRTVVARGGGLDVLGMVLVGAAALALVYPLIEGREQGWPAWVFGLMAVGALLAAAFARYERRLPPARALIQVTLMRNRSFTSGTAVAAGFFAAFAGIILVLSLFWQVGEGFTPIGAALSLVPLSLGMVVGMGASFALVERLGRRLVHGGIVTAAAGLVGVALTSFAQDHPSPWAMVAPVAVVGIGAGAVFGQLFDVILNGVAEAEVGTASGLLNALQQLAFAMGIAAVATVFFNVMDAPHLPSEALGVTALVALVPLLASFVLAFRLPARARPAAH